MEGKDAGSPLQTPHLGKEKMGKFVKDNKTTAPFTACVCVFMHIDTHTHIYIAYRYIYVCARKGNTVKVTEVDSYKEKRPQSYLTHKSLQRGRRQKRGHRLGPHEPV